MIRTYYPHQRWNLTAIPCLLRRFWGKTDPRHWEKVVVEFNIGATSFGLPQVFLVVQSATMYRRRLFNLTTSASIVILSSPLVPISKSFRTSCSSNDSDDWTSKFTKSISDVITKSNTLTFDELSAIFHKEFNHTVSGINKSSDDIFYLNLDYIFIK